MMQKIVTKNAPEAIGPYSQGMQIGDFIFTSGQIPLNPTTGVLEGNTIETQAKQSCENVKAVLEAAGSSLEKVIKTTCYLQNMGDFAVFNQVYAAYFTGCPARSCVAVKELPKGALVEIEAVATKV